MLRSAFAPTALRPRRPLACLLTAALVLSAAGPTATATAGTSDDRDLVLLVGNSFIRKSKSPLKKLVRSAGGSIKISGLTGNGFTLAHHASRAKIFKKVPSREWDYVVLQEQSNGIWFER